MTVRQKTGGDVASRVVFLVAELALVPIGLVIWSSPVMATSGPR